MLSDGKRISGSNVVKKLVGRGFFDLLVADEMHEYKAGDSAQGMAVGTLANMCRTTMGLTGTLMGGYASTLFFLLYRFSSEIRSEFTPDAKGLRKWIKRYGFLRQETLEYTEDVEDQYGGITSRRRVKVKSPKETPGVMPEVLLRLLPSTVFLHLAHVADDLPSYTEHVIQYELDDTVQANGYSQQSAYEALEDQTSGALKEALRIGNMTVVSRVLRALLAYPDGCFRGEKVVKETRNGDVEVIANIPPLDSNHVYPKEQALIDLALSEKEQGRKLLVYATHTNKRDILDRNRDILRGAGLRAEVLRTNSVNIRERAEWIAERVDDIDVLLCQPKLVQTGMDLYDFVSILWLEPEYSTYVMGQASKRSFRIGQTQPCRTYYLAYGDSVQSTALQLCAQKMQVSLAVEGKLSETALTELAEVGEESYLTLARKLLERQTNEDTLAAGIRADSEQIAAMFSEATESENLQDSEMVGDVGDVDWDRLMEKIGSAKTVGDIIGDPTPPVEVVPNGPSSEHMVTIEELAAAFLEDRNKPPTRRRRRRKAPPAAMSLFEFAVTDLG